MRALFVLAGGMCVGGALGMELIGGKVWGDYGRDSGVYALVNTVEEVLEMAGAIIFLYALLTYLAGCTAAADTAGGTALRRD